MSSTEQMSGTGYAGEDEYVVPAVELLAAAMQADPQLWSGRIIMHFHDGGGVQIGMHHAPYDEVHEMSSLLGISNTPFSAQSLNLPRVQW